jgi:hypothetical protein
MITYGRQLTLLLALFVAGLGGCTHKNPNPELSPEYRSYQVQVEANARLEQVLTQLRSELKDDLQKTVKEELLPAVQGLNYVPEDVREKQLRAKNSAFEKVVVGRVEWVTVSSQKIRMKARIDSGAASSSIHAKNLQEKEMDGKTYVQFETEDDDGKSYMLFKEVVKNTKIRSATGVKPRYVVPLKVILGNKEHDINVNLVDRDKLTYNFLVGRDLLMGKYIIDVSQSRLLGK